MEDQEAIGDNEIVYRKISVNSGWYDANKDEVKPDAFKPRKEDLTGISVTRLATEMHPHFQSMKEAARGPSPNGYYVASLRVGNLRAHGMEVVPMPLPDNPGHAEIPDLTYENRKDDRSRSLMALLAHKLVELVEGPFLP